ncbi:cell division protein PerM [Rhizohabitans arisaemae]|uniref:cell division protein PerM n=1 Tax=Rhizohabitans arisaemae TaxID=2720610 RepID=UPI0024B2073B|nr:DUF6350 family protein [Rhizohabitans arisaemae]
MTAILEQIWRRVPRRTDARDDDPRRPLPLSGLLAALWTMAVGMAVLTTLTLAGWIAAPRGSFGSGLPDVFRAAAQIWLVAHHAGFSIDGGWVGLLPLGLIVLPGFLLYRAAVWMARDADLTVRRPIRRADIADPRHRLAQLTLVGQGGVSLAAPYALLAGLLTLIAQNDVTDPSAVQALLAHLLLGFAAGAAATARTLGPWRSMSRLLPERARSLVLGAGAALLILLAAGALLTLIALVVNFGNVVELTEVLAPGVVGGTLLVLLQLLFLPNAVIWAMSYAAGPGFAVGTGTLVAPTGVQLGDVPALPVLGALPGPGAGSALLLTVLAVPFVAGAVGGLVMMRTTPTPNLEAAPLWGFGCGLVTGVTGGLLAGLSGGSLGGGRLAAVGPSAWEVGLSLILEVGVAAGISAGLGNWWLMRRGRTATAAPIRGLRKKARPGTPAPAAHWLDATEAETQPIPVVTADGPAVPDPRPGIVDESDDKGGHIIYVDPYAWDRD